MSDFNPSHELLDRLETIIKAHMIAIGNGLEPIVPNDQFMECLVAVVSGAAVAVLETSAADPVRQANLVTVFNGFLASHGHSRLPWAGSSGSMMGGLVAWAMACRFILYRWSPISCTPAVRRLAIACFAR